MARHKIQLSPAACAVVLALALPQALWAGAIREDIYIAQEESYSKWLDHGSSIGGIGNIRSGTGTFLSLNQAGTRGYVITAAHVVASDQETPHSLSHLSFTLPRDNNGFVSDYEAHNVYFPKKWLPASNEGFRYDIAVVEVDRSQGGSPGAPSLFIDTISRGTKPLYTGDVVGKQVTMAGMGAVGLSNNVLHFSNVSRPDRYPMGITNTLDAITGEGNRVEFDFDGPGDEPNPLGSPDPTGELEGMAMPGDSGSSMLILDSDDQWKLAGIVTSNSGDFGYGTTGGGTRIGAFRGALVRGLQHDYWDALVDESYLADLDMNSKLDASDWQSFQLGLGAMTFSLTDLNNDGETDAADRTLFAQYYDDINGDGAFDELLSPTLLLGDYNADQVVDAADYAVWRQTLGQTVEAGTAADGDRSGLIDAGDYQIWRTHFGEKGPTAPLAGTRRVPEPASLGLGAMALVALVGASRRRSAQGQRN